MPTCPKCGASLKDEYGMSQCPSCGTFSFIDMDGVAQEAEPAEDHVEAVTPGGAASPSEFADPIEQLIEAPVESAIAESPVDDDFASIDMFAPMTPLEAPVTPDTTAPAEFASNEFQSFDISNSSTSFPTNDQEPVDIEADFGPANDPLNLNEFANSEVSSAKDGPLLFRVLISGIDAKEIRESIREVLEDSRFAWDSKEMFSNISHGKLAINGLSPVKASILITRIKRLPITIRWEQYAITEAKPRNDKSF